MDPRELFERVRPYLTGIGIAAAILLTWWYIGGSGAMAAHPSPSVEWLERHKFDSNNYVMVSLKDTTGSSAPRAPRCDWSASVCMDFDSVASTSLTLPASVDDTYELTVEGALARCVEGASPAATLNSSSWPQDVVRIREITSAKIACISLPGTSGRFCAVPCTRPGGSS